jgi:hypothetical protein
VAALAAVVAVAAVDAVRGAGDAPDPEPEALADRQELVARLSQLGVRGELVLSGDGCRTERLALPSLERVGVDEACVPAGAPSPDRRLAARCVGGGIEVVSTGDGELQRLTPGCEPAWRPDGTLTAAHEDAIVRFRPCAEPEPCAVTLISRAELERAARRHPRVPDGPTRLRALIDGLAWLSPTQTAVSLSIRLGGRFEGLGPLGTIAFFEQGRLSDVQPYFRITGGTISASVLGTYVTQTPDVILRSDGSQLTLPQHLRGVRGFAWSPDERFLALARGLAVDVLDVASLERYDRTGSSLRSVTLPVSAETVAWR